EFTVYRTCADLMKARVSVEAQSAEEAAQRIIDCDVDIDDWRCEYPEWAENGWHPEMFEVIDSATGKRIDLDLTKLGTLDTPLRHIAFTETELATVLAALRFWQRERERSATPEWDI